MRFLILRAAVCSAPFAASLILAACSGSARAIDSSDLSQTPERSQSLDLPLSGQSEEKGAPGLSTTLNRLLDEWYSSPQAALDLSLSLGLESDGDRIKITIIMLDEDSADAAETEIAELGGTVEDRYQSWIDAWVPIGSLEAVSAFPGLSQAREPVQAVPLDQ